MLLQKNIFKNKKNYILNNTFIIGKLAKFVSWDTGCVLLNSLETQAYSIASSPPEICIKMHKNALSNFYFAQVQFTWSFKSVDCSRYVGVSLSFVMISSEAGYTTLSDSVFWLAKKLQQRIGWKLPCNYDEWVGEKERETGRGGSCV